MEDKLRVRAPMKLTDAHYSFIDEALQKDDELTTSKLHDLLLKSIPDVEVSTATLKRARRELGWITSTPKYCQLIRDSNKQKRLEWCKKMIDEREDFQDVIWTDESSVMIDPYNRKCYRKVGQARKLKLSRNILLRLTFGGEYHLEGQHVRTYYYLLSDHGFYKICRNIKTGLVSFVQKVYPKGHKFQQDNDPKHCSKYM